MSKILEYLFNCNGVINVSDDDVFEVQSGVYSSIYVNFKATLSDSKTRQAISRIVAQKIVNNCDYICGIESGGSYYAASVADLLNKKLILFRKNKKKYNIKNRFAGTLPSQGDHVVVVDDVMSSGNTIARAINPLRNMGCKVDAVVIFSYSWEDVIAKNMHVDIKVISTALELIKYGLEKKAISEKNAQLIYEYIKREKTRVYGHRGLTEKGDHNLCMKS